MSKKSPPSLVKARAVLAAKRIVASSIKPMKQPLTKTIPKQVSTSKSSSQTVTVTQVRKWMKKFKMEGISKVTADNKGRFLDAVLKNATIKSNGMMDFERNAKIKIQEDFGMKVGNEMIVLDRIKTNIEKTGVDPDFDITKYLERQLKMIKIKPEILEKKQIVNIPISPSIFKKEYASSE